MNKRRYVYGSIVGVFLISQATIGLHNNSEDNKEIKTQIELTDFRRNSKKLEKKVTARVDDKDVKKVVYKYKKKKDFHKVQSVVTSVQNGGHSGGGPGGFIGSEAAQVAKALSGKFLMGQSSDDFFSQSSQLDI
ncbi:hypothetical protein Q2T76_07420 [Lactobacillus sp. YT155]|uniref:hypothetical protein n=1 Tax=Lactobacillus sp. YT155 TaxID=3060955 RepID=UPI00265FB13A|nr:hypothetical protein [Lactobacillus sp. YT155]MDO1605889.1 hypothetical protein [Lactobacillus sp. YT155]